MKRLLFAFGVALLLAWPGPGGSSTAPRPVAPAKKLAQPAPFPPQVNSVDKSDRKRESFKTGRELLRRQGVPFDPDILLDGNWREKVRPFLGRMPEMGLVKWGGNKLKGTQLADTLYLPETIELTGDTVILVRRLVFEGQHVLIKGPHDIHVFPIESEEISGLRPGRRRQDVAARFARAGFIMPASHPALSQSPDAVSLTVDVSGFGAIEWLAQQEELQRAGRTPGGAQFVKAGYAPARRRQTATANGTAGAPGTDGPLAAVAQQANPLLGTKGANGACGNGTSVNGGTGQGGGHGGDGGDGNDGGNGGNGSNAGTINWNLAATGSYWFQAKGGNGGRGGRGSDGAPGAPGGTGGPGGDGANCSCPQGGAGIGGQGGPAGNGGDGGSGSDGGPGGLNGRGGTVNLTKPYGSNPNLLVEVQGGTGGEGGDPGAIAGGGAAGDPGGGGPGVSGGSCGSSSNGGGGAVGTPGDPGFSAGSPGATQPNGAAGTVFMCQTAPGSPPCPGGVWNCNGWQCFSPILIDTSGDGFDLTDAAGGVSFDFFGDGGPEFLSWTAHGSNDAWLTLDRNGNGLVDGGQELFGNLTPQPQSESPHGFLALAEYDKAAQGGNGDGRVSSGDAIFSSLRLWQDANHNGVSEPGELHPLSDFDVESISLDFKESKRTDEHGNAFRYRAKVEGARHSRLGRWAYDVFLLRAP